MAELFNMDVELWRKDALTNEKNLAVYGNDLPAGIRQQHNELRKNLGLK